MSKQRTKPQLKLRIWTGKDRRMEESVAREERLRDQLGPPPRRRKSSMRNKARRSNERQMEGKSLSQYMEMPGRVNRSKQGLRIFRAKDLE